MLAGRDILLTEKRGHVYIMTINREERLNAISLELWDRMAEEWERFNEDDDLWVAILTGKGDASFSSGDDLKEEMDRIEGDTYHDHEPYIGRRPHASVPSWKPTIAAVNGYAVAGGWQLAQECDVRIASENATFGIPEVRWNVPAYFGAALEYQISMGVACEMLMWGRLISAQRAYEIGFVNKVVPQGKLMEECMEWAEYVCTLGQQSVRAHKELIYRGRDIPRSEIWPLGRDLFYFYPPKPGVVTDAAEGPKAFLEKRAPKFKDV